jgi:putative transcriptional regulator
MTVERQLGEVVSVLIMGGFRVSERCDVRPRSFDLIAAKGDRLIVIKVVSHIDSLTEVVAHDLLVISRYLKAVPLVIGERTRDSELERGAVYLRYGIKALSVLTLYDCIVEGVPPLVYAQPGGLYVNINAESLRRLRDEHNLSLGDMATLLGVSRRTISKYESGMGTTLEVAIRIEELFDLPIIEAIDLLAREIQIPQEQPAAEDVNLPSDFERMGLEMHGMRRAPFQALGLFEEETILTGYGPVQKIIRRAALIGNISEVAHTRAICVLTDYRKKKWVGKTLLIGEEELGTLEDGSELLDLIDK